MMSPKQLLLISSYDVTRHYKFVLAAEAIIHTECYLLTVFK